MNIDERQRLDGAGAPQRDGDTDVDERHEDERRHVEHEKVNHGVFEY